MGLWEKSLSTLLGTFLALVAVIMLLGQTQQLLRGPRAFARWINGGQRQTGCGPHRATPRATAAAPRDVRGAMRRQWKRMRKWKKRASEAPAASSTPAPPTGTLAPAAPVTPAPPTGTLAPAPAQFIQQLIGSTAGLTAAA